MTIHMKTVEEVKSLLADGKRLLLAGDEALLRDLPKGEWIGGTIPYFIGDEGGVQTKDAIFVEVLTDEVTEISIKSYPAAELAKIPADAPDNGFSIIVLPAFSEAHLSYAQEAPEYPGLFMKPIIGWITGFDLADLGKVSAKTFDGRTGEAFEDRAVLLHAALPEGRQASIGIVNLFEPGEGPVLTFSETGFGATTCKIDGEERNLAEWLTENEIDTRLPLVADVFGSKLNTSIQNVDPEAGKVDFYAPVFEGTEYRVAKPVADYVGDFVEAIPEGAAGTAFSCNCILNYLYSELEGKKIGAFTGPMTFGEVAYQLLNQTMVYLEIRDAS